MGTWVGRTEGTNVGASEKSLVGLSVGTADGRTVGTMVGAAVVPSPPDPVSVGLTVGNAVGCTDGTRVMTLGTAVGLMVGTNDGATVGTTVGTRLGLRVGPTDGVSVGSSDGTQVGDGVAPSNVKMSVVPVLITGPTITCEYTAPVMLAVSHDTVDALLQLVVVQTAPAYMHSHMHTADAHVRGNGTLCRNTWRVVFVPKIEPRHCHCLWHKPRINMHAHTQPHM